MRTNFKKYITEKLYHGKTDEIPRYGTFQKLCLSQICSKERDCRNSWALAAPT